MKKILIAVDHKWRDLPSSVLLKLKLEKKGYKVFLCRDSLIPFYAEGIKPHAIIFVHLYDQERQVYAKKLKQRNVKVFLLPTEGIPTLESYRKFASGFFNDLSGVEEQFCWNDNMKKIVEKNTSLKKVTTVGVPRFDFYSEKLNKTFISKEKFCKKYDLEPGFPIITFATNFTQAQFYKKNKKFFKNDSEKLGYKTVFESNAIDSKKIPELDYISREKTMEFFSSLVKRNQNCNFILKTHPSEDFTYYKKFLSENLKRFKSRIALVNQEYIWDILNVTDIELSRSCTTAVESWLLNLPTIELRLSENEWYQSKDFAAGSYSCSKPQEYFDLIDSLLEGKNIDNDLIAKREKFFKEWCYKIDGNSTDRLVSRIDKSLKNSSATLIYKTNVNNFLIYLLLKISRNLIHDLKVYGYNIFLQNKLDKLGRIDKYITEKDVTFWEKKLRSYI